MVATEPWSQAIVVSLVLMEMCHSVSFCYLRHAHFVSHVSTYAVVKLPQQSRGGHGTAASSRLLVIGGCWFSISFMTSFPQRLLGVVFSSIVEGLGLKQKEKFILACRGG